MKNTTFHNCKNRINKESEIHGEHSGELVSFQPPWTSPYTIDPKYPNYLINREGNHIFIVNKTAWTYFVCKNPEDVLKNAVSQGVNLLRVALEGTPYYDILGYDIWPWLGTRQNPDWTGFNSEYWEQVEERIKLTGEYGIGLDIVIYFTLHPGKEDLDNQKNYWNEILFRLSKYSNILTWEMANEYIKNEEFQNAAGAYFKANDPCKRPVCTSDGTTDDAVWPDKEWVGLAVNHSCTSSTEKHPLKEWYWAVAANTRSHGKPAFCNESGREVRHKNDDPIHRRKQGWIWSCAGGFWTWHSWDGCEGINDSTYRAPGQEFVKPMADFFRSIDFWEMTANYTSIAINEEEMFSTVLASADRRLVIGYICTYSSGKKIIGSEAKLFLPAGTYSVSFLNPVDGSIKDSKKIVLQKRNRTTTLKMPEFTDDILIRIGLLKKEYSMPLEDTL